MYRVLASTCVSQLHTTFSVISGQFSERMCSGTHLHQHDIGHGLKQAKAIDPARSPDGQAFTGELVDQGRQAKLAVIVGLGLHEVV